MSRANSQNPNLDVQVEAFIRSLAAKGGQPLHEIGYDAARKVLSDVQDICVEKGIVDIKDIDIPLENGGAARIRLICPEDAGIRLPVIFYIHGGGWVMGDENTHDRLIRELAVGANAAVVFPVPGGPKNIMFVRWPESTILRSIPPGPTRFSCPTMSSNPCGLTRSARG